MGSAIPPAASRVASRLLETFLKANFALWLISWIFSKKFETFSTKRPSAVDGFGGGRGVYLDCAELSEWLTIYAWK